MKLSAGQDELNDAVVINPQTIVVSYGELSIIMSKWGEKFQPS